MFPLYTEGFISSVYFFEKEGPIISITLRECLVFAPKGKVRPEFVNACKWVGLGFAEGNVYGLEGVEGTNPNIAGQITFWDAPTNAQIRTLSILFPNYLFRYQWSSSMCMETETYYWIGGTRCQRSKEPYRGIEFYPPETEYPVHTFCKFVIACLHYGWEGFPLQLCRYPGAWQGKFGECYMFCSPDNWDCIDNLAEEEACSVWLPDCSKENVLRILRECESEDGE